MTLAFLGSREQAEAGAIAAAVASAVRPVGPLRTGPALLLPPRRPRVLAVRLEDPSGACVALQGAVSEALTRARAYEPERRRWLPHVTIGRARGQIARDVALPEVPALTFVPETVTLYSSLLRRGGALYEPVERFELPVGTES